MLQMNPVLCEKCENFKIKSIQLFSAKKKKKINYLKKKNLNGEKTQG